MKMNDIRGFFSKITAKKSMKKPEVPAPPAHNSGFRLLTKA